MARITVIGAGIIGLACAWRLREAGHAVTVLDGAPATREASWAAAGMLAPHHEYDPALGTPEDAAHAEARWRLGCDSLARWPAFVTALGGPAACDFREEGGLVPLLPEDADAVRARVGHLRAQGVPVTSLQGPALRTLAPALAADEALLLPAAQVDPRRVTTLLAATLGPAVRFGDPVVTLDGPRATTASGQRVEADQVVLASGAWTPALATLAGVDLPGEPVKGQMLRFALDDRPWLHAFVHCHQAYLVPRAGAGLIVGSTMRWTGFDKTDDAEDIARLTASARRLLPGLPLAPVEAWTGLRPRLAHGLPHVERVSPHLLIATGHFRNGILLTPWTAERVAGLIGSLGSGSIPL